MIVSGPPATGNKPPTTKSTRRTPRRMTTAELLSLHEHWLYLLHDRIAALESETLMLRHQVADLDEDRAEGRS